MAVGDTPPDPNTVSKEKKFLYIATVTGTSSPDQIFNEGFTALGVNLNMLDHYSWRYFSRRESDIFNSGFIDAYGDEQSAIRAVSVARGRSGNTLSGYVYRLRADEHSYNAAIGMQDLLRRMREAGTYSRSIFDMQLLISGLESGYQYIVDQPVAADRVESAAPFTYRYEGPMALAPPQITVSPARLRNAAYVERNSFVNASPYPMALPPSTPPESSDSGSLSSSSCSDSDDDSAESNCDGDRLAVTGAFGVLSTAMIVCLPPNRDKRSTDPIRCPTLSAVNLSRRARALRVLLFESAF